MMSFNFNYPCGYKACVKKRRNFQQIKTTPQLFIRRLSSKFPIPEASENIYSKINIFDQSQIQQQDENMKRFRTLETRRNFNQAIINQSSFSRPMSSILATKNNSSSPSKIKPKTIYLRNNKSKRPYNRSCHTQRIVQLNISKKHIDSRPSSAQNYRYNSKAWDSQELNQTKKRYKFQSGEVNGKKKLKIEKKESIISPW